MLLETKQDYHRASSKYLPYVNNKLVDISLYNVNPHINARPRFDYSRLLCQEKITFLSITLMDWIWSSVGLRLLRIVKNVYANFNVGPKFRLIILGSSLLCQHWIVIGLSKLSHKIILAYKPTLPTAFHKVQEETISLRVPSYTVRRSRSFLAAVLNGGEIAFK